MHPEKSQGQRPTEPTGAKPPPAKVPHVAAPKSGKPPVVVKRRQPRVAQKRTLPPNFKPRFPDEVDFLTAQKPPPKWRTRYYAVAIVLHVILLTFLGYKMVYEPLVKTLPPPELPAMKFAGDGLKPVGPENIPAPPAPPNHSLDKLVDVAPQVGPTPTVPRGLTVPTRVPTTTRSLPVIALFNPKIPGNVTAPSGVQGAAGVSNDPFVGRRSGLSRGGAVRRYGGSDASEAAVIKALRWLKKNQNTGQAEMGSWGGQYKVAMTGLALLAFLGHGETHESPEFEQTIKEALNYLAPQSDQSQAPTSGYIGTARFEYQHPIATYAMCEDYAITRYAPLKRICEGAVEQIINAQRPDGSWDYDYNTGPGGVYNLKNRPSGDSSISAWNVQALVAAKNTGLAIPGLDEAMSRSRKWFHNIYDHGSAEFLASEFSGSFTTQGLLEAVAAAGMAVPEATTEIESLNKLLRGDGLRLKFKGIPLSKEAEDLMRRVSSLIENERVRLNRLVLEAAYPQKCPKKDSGEQGRFGYAVRDRLHSDALDGIGVLCLQLLGDSDAAEVKQTLPRLLNVPTKFRSANANSTYGWYYITQALFHAGGHWWAEWNSRLRDQLVENQDADGSWGSPGSAAWQDNMTTNKVKGKDTRVYHTTLMCLALEVYYRFLPSFNVFNLNRPEASAPGAGR